MILFEAVKSWLKGKAYEGTPAKKELSKEDIQMKEIGDWLALRSEINIYKELRALTTGVFLDKYETTILDDETARVQVKHDNYLIEFTFYSREIITSFVSVMKRSECLNRSNMMVLVVKDTRGKIEPTWCVESNLWIGAIHSHLSELVQNINRMKEEAQKEKEKVRRKRLELETEYLQGLLHK